jgi:hypothetical protein
MTQRFLLQSVVFVLVLLAATSSYAEEGEILIDQERALQGRITPGDEPGFPITLSRPGRYKLVGNLNLGATMDSTSDRMM